MGGGQPLCLNVNFSLLFYTFLFFLLCFSPSSSFLVPQTCWLPLLLSSVLPQPPSSPSSSAWCFTSWVNFSLFSQKHCIFTFIFTFIFALTFTFSGRENCTSPNKSVLLRFFTVWHHDYDNALHCNCGNKNNDNLKEIHWKRKSFGNCL